MKRTKYLWLYLAISCFYVLTGSGRIGGADARSMYLVGINMADHGNVRAEPCDSSWPNPQCVPGVDGHYYSAYGILPSLLAVPTYTAAKVVTRLVHVPISVAGGFFTMQMAALVAAAVPVAMLWWVELMGYSWGAGCFAAIALAFGTPFWFHGVKEYYSEPFMTLPMILSAILLLYGKDRRWFAAAGLLLGVACSARLVAGLVLPLYLGVLLYRRWRTPGMWVDAISFLAPMGGVLLLIGVYNNSRYGSFLKTGYGMNYLLPSRLDELHQNNPPAATGFGVPLWRGLWSFLFQPDNSLLYFAPLALLSPWGAVWLYRKKRLDAIVAVGTFLVFLLFFSKFIDRPAAWCYGPRYLVPAMPFLFVTLCAVWDRVGPGTRWLRGSAIALLAVSLVIHVVGTIYPLPLYYWKHGWVSARTGNEEFAGYLRSMFTELPEVMRDTVQAQGGRGVADPLGEMTGKGAESFADFEAFVQSFPNPINVVGVDIWLVKFAIVMHARWLCGGIALVLLGAGCWFLTKGLSGASTDRMVRD